MGGKGAEREAYGEATRRLDAAKVGLLCAVLSDRCVFMSRDADSIAEVSSRPGPESVSLDEAAVRACDRLVVHAPGHATHRDAELDELAGRAES